MPGVAFSFFLVFLFWNMHGRQNGLRSVGGLR